MGLFGMNKKEINQKLATIEQQYQEYTRIYGSKYFDFAGFKSRYLKVLSGKGDLAFFFDSENNLLRDIVKNIELKKQSLLASKKSIDSSIEKMASNIIDQLKDYPEVNIGERASLEMRKLVGTCKEIYPKIEPFKTVVNVNNYTIFSQCLNSIKDIVKEPYSSDYRNYLDIIKNPMLPMTKTEIFTQKILKDVGIAIKTIITLIDLSTHKSDFMATREYLQQVLIDFRLNIFESRTLNK